MPNIKSAKKRVAVTEKKNTQNKMIKSAVKTAVKKYNALLAAGDLAVPETVSVIDSAVSKGILHKNNAANKKSALAKNLNSAKAAAEKAAAEEKAAAKEEAKEEAKAAPAAEPVAEEKPKRTRKKKADAE